MPINANSLQPEQKVTYCAQIAGRRQLNNAKSRENGDVDLSRNAYPKQPSGNQAIEAPRILIRPRAGFYLLRAGRGQPLVPATIQQRCPMVLPQPHVIGGPHPEDWCRPLDRSPVLHALINGEPVPIDRVWTARSLRPISASEYAFRMGPLRQWAWSGPRMPEAYPDRPVNLASLPPLY